MNPKHVTMNHALTAALLLLASAPAAAYGVPDCMPQSSLFVPGQGTFGMLMFEDMYPARGDFDLNDVVVSYNWELHVDALGRLTRALLTLTPLASGGRTDSGIALTLPFAPGTFAATATLDGAASSPVTIEASGSGALLRVVPDTKALFGVPSGTHVNADPPIAGGARRTTVRGQTVLVDIQLGAPVAFTASWFSPGDIFIFHTQAPSVEIHLPSYAGSAAFDARLYRTADDASVDGVRYFVDRSGIPFALALPAASVFPREGLRLESVYPQIVEFGASGGTQGTGFYNTPVTSADVAVVPGFAPTLPGDHPRARFLAGALAGCPAENVIPPATVIPGEVRIGDGTDFRAGCPAEWSYVGSVPAGPSAAQCGHVMCSLCQSPATPSLMPTDYAVLMTDCPAGWTDVGTPPAGPSAASCGARSCRLCLNTAGTLPSGSSMVMSSCPSGWVDQGLTSAGPGAVGCSSGFCHRCAAPGAAAALPRAIPAAAAVLVSGSCPAGWGIGTYTMVDPVAGAEPQPTCSGAACSVCNANGSALARGARAMFAGQCPAGWSTAGSYAVADTAAGAEITGVCAGEACAMCESPGTGVPTGARMVFAGTCPSGWLLRGDLTHQDTVAGAEAVASCNGSACRVCEAQ